VTISEMPETPQLTLTTEACNVTLNIHDLSNTEDGFFVYRRLEGEPNWVRIATLNNASNSDWLTYTDSGHPGPITYYAAAFNSQGEAASNLAPAQVDPAACPAISPALPQLSIELVDLIVDGPADQVYCYKSLGGVLWSRWPAGGFFLPGPEGFDVQGQGESLLLEGLEGDSLSLDLECWGWVGGSLQLLGKFHEDDIANPTRLGDLRLQNDRLRLDLALGGGIKPLDKHQPEPPMDTTMPRIFAIKLFGADACVGHTPNAIMAVLICTWYPEYEQSNQPYLVWDTNDNSCADPGGGCAPLSWYVDRADLYGGYVAFRVRTITNEQNLDFVSSNFPVAATPHDVTAWAIAPQQSQCGKLMGLYVQIFFQSGANDPDYGGQAFVSPPSNTVYHPIYCSPPNEVKLDVVFDSLNLSQVDDGWNADLELYASLVAEGIPGTGSVLNLGYWGWQGDDCDDDTVGFILDPGGLDLDPECTLQLGSGDHPFSDMYLCSSDTYAHCIGNYSQNNNRIQITVGNGSKVRISVHIMDFDDGSGDDTVCQTQTFIGPKSNAEWAGFTTNGELDDVQSSAGCEVSFHVSPAP
jgi:hypothetical protein